MIIYLKNKKKKIVNSSFQFQSISQSHQTISNLQLNTSSTSSTLTQSQTNSLTKKLLQPTSQITSSKLFAPHIAVIPSENYINDRDNDEKRRSRVLSPSTHRKEIRRESGIFIKDVEPLVHLRRYNIIQNFL